MSRVVKNSLPFFHLLTCCPEHQRQFLLETATPEQIHALVQILFNIRHGNIPASKEVKRNLKKHIDALVFFFFCILFIYLFILFYRYKTRTYRSIRRNITKFTTNTLITNYKGEKKTTLHYTTLQGFHNLFNLNLKKSNLGKVWITATVVLMGVKVSIFYCGNEFCCFFSR